MRIKVSHRGSCLWGHLLFRCSARLRDGGAVWELREKWPFVGAAAGRRGVWPPLRSRRRPLTLTGKEDKEGDCTVQEISLCCCCWDTKMNQYYWFKAVGSHVVGKTGKRLNGRGSLVEKKNRRIRYFSGAARKTWKRGLEVWLVGLSEKMLTDWLPQNGSLV